MKRLLTIITSLFFILAITSTSFASEVDGTPNFKDYLVSFDNDEVDVNLIKNYGGEVKRQYQYMPVVSVKLSEKAAKALAKNAKVEYIEPDGRVKAIGQETPWGVPHVKATEVQESGITGTGVKVGVLDTGVDFLHEDLNVSGGATFVSDTDNYMDDNGHGTHVAGTVAAQNNTIGVIGVAPKVELYGIKVLDQSGYGSYSDVIAGIEWATTNNLDILNMSFSGETGSRTLQRALDNAYNSGVLLVGAAGNNGFDRKGNVGYPAKYDSVIAVGAIDQQNNRADFSSVGRELEIMAPGVTIKSTIPGGYAFSSGTSMAAPHVVGVAALLSESSPELDNIQVRNRLNDTATNLGDSFYFGNGLVDAQAAISTLETTSTKGNGTKKPKK
ncbi:S8 family peptidase [Gracilibacillus sp. YIM 98692]|uniref:S8 family peptidase n=1 Tax=Gracilibacillus sp. YIM 98692 TaxID=2663532 RepID=UPI0013D26C4D|nr:S8 family peptidase [Gracilibacillus sp. YIM 98692]